MTPARGRRHARRHDDISHVDASGDRLAAGEADIRAHLGYYEMGGGGRFDWLATGIALPCMSLGTPLVIDCGSTATFPVPSA
jgi:hypothetical protein